MPGRATISICTDHGDDTVWSGDSDDWVSASFGDDVLYGEAGDDYISHGFGVNQIHGSDGDERIGVSRNDGVIAYGASGSDTFFFDHDMGINTVWGGDGGSDVDIIAFDLLWTDPVNITLTSDEDGTAPPTALSTSMRLEARSVRIRPMSSTYR